MQGTKRVMFYTCRLSISQFICTSKWNPRACKVEFLRQCGECDAIFWVSMPLCRVIFYSAEETSKVLSDKRIVPTRSSDSLPLATTLLANLFSIEFGAFRKEKPPSGPDWAQTTSLSSYRFHQFSIVKEVY